MRQIKLTQNKVALVSDEDYEWLNQWKWQATFRKHTYYAKRTVGPAKDRCVVFMHRLILGLTKREQIGEHKDRDGLNNQRNNLREATQSQNRANSVSQPNSTSKYLGVSWDSSRKKWIAVIGKNKKVKNIGRFKSESEAALAYNKHAVVLHGEFARLNTVTA